jgi:hypothetical protein
MTLVRNEALESLREQNARNSEGAALEMRLRVISTLERTARIAVAPVEAMGLSVHRMITAAVSAKSNRVVSRESFSPPIVESNIRSFVYEHRSAVDAS